MSDGTHPADTLSRIEQALSLLRHPMPAQTLMPSEVARLLRVSAATVRRLIEAGRLKAAKITTSSGRHLYRVRQEDYNEFVQAEIIRPATEPSRARKMIQVPK